MNITDFKLLMKDYRKKSLAYNRDCNVRFLGRGKTDKKRETLRQDATEAFESVISAFNKIAGIKA